MNQYTWTYIGDAGYSETVGLYHSSKSGHLLIYVGKKIVVIDFKVLDSKTYSFFINDDLCELRLERKDLKMYYHFEINKEADTPRNQARKKVEQKYFRQALAFFGVLVLGIVAIAIFFNLTLGTEKHTAELLQNPSKTVAQIKIDSTATPPSMSYFFIANNKNFTAKSDPSKNNNLLFSNVLPLQSGDEFLLEYAATNPTVNKIIFEQPTDKQLEIYAVRVFKKHLQLNPDLDAKKEACKLDIAFKMHGIDALAHFYFQNTSPADNPVHNKNSYLRLIRSLPFQKEVDNLCW